MCVERKQKVVEGGCLSRRGDFEGTGGGGIGDGRCCPSMTSVNLWRGLLLGGGSAGLV